MARCGAFCLMRFVHSQGSPAIIPFDSQQYISFPIYPCDYLKLFTKSYSLYLYITFHNVLYKMHFSPSKFIFCFSMVLTHWWMNKMAIMLHFKCIFFNYYFVTLIRISLKCVTLPKTILIKIYDASLGHNKLMTCK